MVHGSSGGGAVDVVDPADLPLDTTIVVVNALAGRGMPPPMPGCERRQCAACGRDTWAAPSTIAAEHVREVVTLCKSDALLLAGELGGVTPYRLPGADADVNAPGSLVTEEGEEAVALLFRPGGGQ